MTAMFLWSFPELLSFATLICGEGTQTLIPFQPLIRLTKSKVCFLFLVFSFTLQFAKDLIKSFPCTSDVIPCLARRCKVLLFFTIDVRLGILLD
jgi:hypothetical protein